MLSDATRRVVSEAGVRPPVTRRAAVFAAVGPTARVAHLGPAAVTAALAAVPVIVTLARGADVSAPLIVAGLFAGAALAWAVDDQAADLMGSLPVSSSVRTSLRVGLVASLSILGAVL